MSNLAGLRSKRTRSAGRLLLTLALSAPIIIWLFWLFG